MTQNFTGCDREQAFLLPPSLREWLPEDHLAWFVIDAVEEMDLAEFYADHRADGHGRAAYDPSMMVALLLYAYANEQRSARAIERHCRQDVAYRVICANRVADHATIARFVCRHEAALARLFGSVLALCARAGLVWTGVVVIDGTKLAANASREANLDYERIAREISLTQGRPTRPRMSSTARRAGTSCPRSSGRSTAAGVGLPRPSASSSPGRLQTHPRRLSSSPPTSLPRCRAAGRSTRVAAAGCATPANAPTSAASARRARSRARARRA